MVASLAAAAALPPGLSALASGPSSSARDASAHVTDGPVYAVAHQAGGNTYIGGDFDHVGPRSGHGLALTAAEAEGGGGAVDFDALEDPQFPEVAGGEVRAVASDGHGGWFIGGDFTSVGGEAVPRLAHIFGPGASGPARVDTEWVPKPNGAVLALALDSFDYASRPGDWTLYAGGNFTQFESTEILRNDNRDFLAAWRVEADSGAPRRPEDDVDPVLGPFPDEEPLDWEPWRNVGNTVRALAVTTLEYDVDDGSGAVRTPTPIVIAGGDFTMADDGTASNRLLGIWGEGALDGSGNDREGDTFGSVSLNNGSVRALAAGPTASNTDALGQEWQSVAVYAGGDFSLPNPPRLRAVRLRVRADDAPTSAGQVSFNIGYSWSPNPSHPVRALALSGNTLYAGGEFTTIRGQDIPNLAALEGIPNAANAPTCDPGCPATADPGWKPEPNGTIRALATGAAGESVHAGGEFTRIGAVSLPEEKPARNGLAALAGVGQVGAGSALPWDARPAGGSINALARQGDALYAGGGFFSVGAEPHANLAALDPDGVVVSDFRTGTSCEPQPGCQNEVRSLALDPSAQRLYVGGVFTDVDDAPAVPGAEPRLNLATLELDPAAGEPLGAVAADWAPNPDDGVLSLDVAGERLYAGGAFDRIGSVDPQPRSKLAALDRETGEPLAWNPDPKRIGPGGEEPFSVYDIEASCDTVYAGGSFNRIGIDPPALPDGTDPPQPSRTSIAELDPNTAAATPWNPNPDDHPGAVRTLAVHGGIVYAGGNFSNMGATSEGGTALRQRIAAVRRSDAQATSWNPEADGAVYALGISGDGETVYAGGIFDRIGAFERWGLAALQADGVGNGFGEPTAWDPSAREPGTVTSQRRSNVWALAAAGDNVYAGGEFTDIGTSAQRGYAQFTGAEEDQVTDPLPCEGEGPPAEEPPPPPLANPAPAPVGNTSPLRHGPAFVTDGGRTLVLTLSGPGAIHVDLTGSTTGVRMLKRSTRGKKRSAGKKRSSSQRKRAHSRKKRRKSGSRCAPSTARNLKPLRRELRERVGKKRWRRLPRRKRAKRLRKLAAKRACSAPIRPRSIDVAGWPGQNRISLAAAGPLPPGRYRATVVVRDAAGNSAGPVVLDFEVKQ